MCGIPAHALERYVEKLRENYGVVISATQDSGNERKVYALASIGNAPVQEAAEPEQLAAVDTEKFRFFNELYGRI